MEKLELIKQRLNNAKSNLVLGNSQTREDLIWLIEEIERLRLEVVKRNQYKINQEYLDNIHTFYEEEIYSLKQRYRAMLLELASIKNE